MNMQKLLATVLCLVFVNVLGMMGCREAPPPPNEFDQVSIANENQDYAAVRRLGRAIPKSHDRWPEVQVMIGRAEAISRGPKYAIQYLESVPRDQSSASYEAARVLAEQRIKVGALFLAAKDLRYLLERNKDNQTSHLQLAQILVQSGVRTEADEHMLWLVQNGRLDVKELISLSIPERRGDEYSRLKQALQWNGADPYVNLGMAIEEVHEFQWDRARERLWKLVQAHPDLAEAQALLGELILDQGLDSMGAWNSQLPVAVQSHYGIWYVRGLWAAALKNHQVASRCFWETLKQRPHDRRANYQLGVTLAPLDAAIAAQFTQRASELKEYADNAERALIAQGRDQKLLMRIVDTLVGMGRHWEAKGWADITTEMLGPTDPLVTGMRAKINAVSTQPRFDREADLVRKNDLSRYPDFGTLEIPNTVSSAPTIGADAKIHFEEEAQARGLNFTYFQSPDKQTNGVRIFESIGGGVAVSDYDLDGSPDIYLPQGEPWKPGADQPSPSPQYADRLYRLRTDRFTDVTEAAGLSVEEGYGQGCSCGDFNNDGFVDLYVANIGRNQLLMNNGDGTFSDVTASCGLAGSDWTSSCLIGDLNADGHPDLYDVNYLQGETMFRTECSANRCSVRNFAGCPDRVQLSNGDGTFREVLNATPRENAKGLGIVTVYLNDESQPSLFISNDQVPNHFLRPEPDGTYRDEATQNGLALNMNGQPTACMGVASGDLNHDGLTDLFVTNFEGEANNLYLQRSEGFFEDAITGTGLLAAGVPYVGWGTQFLDADNDGEFDLVVANGHVADFGQGAQYQMPTQFFRNRGNGKFQQLSAADAGAVFDTPVLGRAIALLDWNQDGRTDFVQSNIATPAMLVTNQTANSGHCLTIRLHGRQLSRDALGAVVTIQYDGRSRTQQLLGGNGFQATNQRQLSFGLGEYSQSVEVTVVWPGGGTSSFRNVPGNCTLEVSEGVTAATVWTPEGPQGWN